MEEWLQWVTVLSLVPRQQRYVQHAALAVLHPGRQSRVCRGAGKGRPWGWKVVQVVAEPSQMSTGPTGAGSSFHVRFSCVSGGSPPRLGACVAAFPAVSPERCYLTVAVWIWAPIDVFVP